ncbi:hypothetical protein RUM44_012364 [Polyplax serrata]|uniref:BTB domain-containing protein n=1 Tax=Polyplax serrata TaxID=468196 RepID=A0ABR1BF02_POLSC
MNNREEAIYELADVVSRLYGSEKFSDINIKLKDRVFSAHRLILHARGGNWSTVPLSQINSLNWEHIDPEVCLAILKWVYTFDIDLPLSEEFVLNLIKHAGAFNLKNLCKICEKKLIEFSCFENCIKFYAIAGDISATLLKDHCATLINKNWDSFTAKDFKDINAKWLNQLLKTNAEHPLHAAVKFQRLDLVEQHLNESKGEMCNKMSSIIEAILKITQIITQLIK